MLTRGFLFGPGSGYLLRLSRTIIKATVDKLNEPEFWMGYHVHDPDTKSSYFRLQCRKHLFVDGRELMFGLHDFKDPSKQASTQLPTMHNHRYPLLIIPFSESGVPKDMLLYEMPWESKDKSGNKISFGCHSVYSGQPYSIEDCLGVFHSVKSARRHFSIAVGDVTFDAKRENRLEVKMDENAGEEFRQTIIEHIHNL